MSDDAGRWGHLLRAGRDMVQAGDDLHGELRDIWEAMPVPRDPAGIAQHNRISSALAEWRLAAAAWRDA